MAGFFLVWIIKGILYGLLWVAIIVLVLAATFGCLGMIQVLIVCVQGRPAPHLLCVESTDTGEGDY